MTQPSTTKTLVVITGPTAVGKTDISLKLAGLLNCPILSADARQCYRELGIATAKPTPEQRRQVPHYFIDSHSIFEPVSAADFEQYALNILGQVYAEHDHCVMTGGSGLYIDAVCKGFDPMPSISPEIRSQLQESWEEKGLDHLLTQLKLLDPQYYETVDRANHRRVIRALEVCLSSGKPFSDFRQNLPQERYFEIIKIGLYRERVQLYQRIEDRMAAMIADGLFEEAENLYPHRHLIPLQTVGYQEIFKFLEGQIDRTETIRLLNRNSRRYAKRQLTWMRNDGELMWIDADDYAAVRDYSLSGIKY